MISVLVVVCVYLFSVGGKSFHASEAGKPWSRSGTYDEQIETARHLAKLFIYHLNTGSSRCAPGGCLGFHGCQPATWACVLKRKTGTRQGTKCNKREQEKKKKRKGGGEGTQEVAWRSLKFGNFGSLMASADVCIGIGFSQPIWEGSGSYLCAEDDSHWLVWRLSTIIGKQRQHGITMPYKKSRQTAA